MNVDNIVGKPVLGYENSRIGEVKCVAIGRDDIVLTIRVDNPAVMNAITNASLGYIGYHLERDTDELLLWVTLDII